MLLGCHKTMTPIYGGMHYPERAHAGTVDVHASGSAVKRMRSMSTVTAPGADRSMWSGALNLTPQLTQHLALPLEAQISPIGLGEPGYDVVTRVGARFVYKCSDSNINCDDQQRASDTTFAVGFGGGPNVQISEGPQGQLMRAYGWNIDSEFGTAQRLNEMSFHLLGRFGYYNNQATASALWSTVMAGLGFHPSSAQIISLGVRVGLGTVLESRDDKLIELVQEMGAQLTWSIRFGASESPHDQKSDSL